jgi:hypothetical protein
VIGPYRALTCLRPQREVPTSYNPSIAISGWASMGAGVGKLRFCLRPPPSGEPTDPKGRGWPRSEIDNPPLGFRITLNVPLSGRQRSATSKLLNVSERPSGRNDVLGAPRNEGPPTGVR